MLRLQPSRHTLICWINRLFRAGLLSLLLGITACGGPQPQNSSNLPVSPAVASSASPDQTPLTPSAIAPATPPAELIADLKARVSRELGIAEPQLQVQESQAVDWPDSCLGAAQAEELCAQMITPGYRIVLSNGTQQFEFHTDRSGKAVRQMR